MTAPGHTFGADCLLQATSNAFNRRASEASVDPPKISAQFFYCSALPIDDPLSPVPPPSPASKSSRVPPRPFSVQDNIALETAWLKLQEPEQSTNQGNLPKHIAKIMRDAQNEKPSEDGKSSKQKPGGQGKSPKLSAEGGKSPKQKPVGQDKSPKKSAEEGNAPIKAQSVDPETKAYAPGQRDKPYDFDVNDPHHVPFDANMPITPPELANEESAATRRKSRSSFRRKENDEKNVVSSRSLRRPLQAGEEANELALSSSPSERDTTGTPFLRVPPRKEKRSRSHSRSRSGEEQLPTTQVDGADIVETYKPKHSSPLRPMFQEFSSSHSKDGGGSRGRSPSRKQERPQEAQVVRVQVGHSRLHIVEMPSLKVRAATNNGKPCNGKIQLADPCNKDGAYLLGSCSRRLVCRSWDLVLQEYNVPR